jgi:ribonuclease J
MNATQIFTGQNLLKNNFITFEAWKSFEINDIKITPYLVDHSSVDAYAFLIEYRGEKIIYSGDFRANGRKSKLFENMLQQNQLKKY